MEILVTVGIISFIIYLRFFADLRTGWEKEVEQLQKGIALFDADQIGPALAYFNQTIRDKPGISIAYLYRARCYRELGDSDAALQDLTTGKSYDNTVPDLHLESGQIHYEQREYRAAFQDFDKAIFHSHGQEPEPFRWRAMTRQHLQQSDEAQHDFEKATALAARGPVTPGSHRPVERSFPDRRFVLNAALMFMSSLLLLLIIKRTTVIHWPYLYAAVSAAAIGYIEPRKGWLLAILQAATLWIGYTYFTDLPVNNESRALQAFSLYGAIILTFIGSFTGGMLQRTLGR